MSILNVNKINPIGGGSTVTIAGIASVTNSVTAPTFVGDINNSTLLLQTGSSERLRITSDGDVGINVTPTNNDMAGVKPRLHVSGISTDGQFNTVARFQAGGDADSTGAMIVINHGNDRGLAIQGGRISGNYAHGALKMIDFSGRLSDAMVIHGGAGQGINDISFFTGVSTTTTKRLFIDSSGNVVIGHTAANGKLQVNNGTNSVVGDSTNPAFQIGGTTTYRLGIYTTSEQAIIANKNGDDGIAFHTKTANSGSFGEALRISSAGYVTKPTNPIFHAFGAPSTVAINTDIVFGQERFDVGGGYNTSTGEYTAPATGYYHFYTQVYRQDTQNDSWWGFYLDSGSGYVQISESRMENDYGGDSGRGYSTLQSSIYWYMTAGHKIKCRTGTTGTIHCNNTLSYFCGNLVG